MPGKRSPTGYRLVPEALRKKFIALSVHFDFQIAKENVEEFRNAWNQTAPRSRERWGPFSEKADPVVGLAVLAPGDLGARDAYHAILEYRKGSPSPYPRIPCRRMQYFAERLRRHAESIEVSSLVQTVETEKSAFTKEESGLTRILDSDGRETVDGYRAKVTGFALSAEKPDNPPIWVEFDWGGEAVRMTVSTKGLRFASLEELLDTEKVTIDVPKFVPRTSAESSKSKDEPRNAHAE